MKNFTTEDKPQIIEDLAKAKVTNKEAIKLIYNFEKRVNTMRNMIYSGISFNVVYRSDAYNSASMLHSTILNKFKGEWESYSQVRGYFKGANLGDFLS